MADDKVKEFRESILSKLAIIAEQSDLIGREASRVRHSRGKMYRSLKPRSGMYIRHSEDGFFQVEYIDGKGEKYEIKVQKKEDSPSLFSL